jgi:hypothetical protein
MQTMLILDFRNYLKCGHFTGVGHNESLLLLQTGKHPLPRDKMDLAIAVGLLGPGTVAAEAVAARAFATMPA